MKNLTAIHRLIFEELSILFNAEKQLLNYLQVIKNKSQTPALQSLLNVMMELSFSRNSELNHIFQQMQIHYQGITCEAMNGLIRENLSLISHMSDIRLKEHVIINFLHQANRYKSTAYTWIHSHMTDTPQFIEANNMIQEILKEENSISSQITEVEYNLLFLKHFREPLVSY